MFYTGYVALTSIKAMDNISISLWNFEKTGDGYLLNGNWKTITMLFYTFVTVMPIIIQHGAMLQNQIDRIYKVLHTQI